MRLLILNDHWGALGGGEVVAAQLAAELRREHQVAVLTTDCQRDSVERQDGLTIYRVRSSYPARLRPVMGLVNPLALAGTRRVLAAFRPNLVHAWNVHDHISYASLALARRAGIPTVLTFQDALAFCHTKFHCYIDRSAPCPIRPDYRARPNRCASCHRNYWLFPPRNRLTRTLIRRYVSAPVAVSQALAEALVDNDLPRPTVLHNGLPLEQFPARPELIARLRQRFTLGPEAVIAGGRMGFFKGQHQLLESFAELANRRPAAQLVLAGRHDDWYGQQLVQRAAELKLNERVIFAGFLPHPDFVALLGAGAMFATLSLYLDPFPTVNLETGAAGRPVLGTRFGGTPEVVIDGVTGRLVNPFRLPEVTTALENLLADPDRRERLGVQAAQVVRERFPMRAMIDGYSRLFESLV
jgi:glycosyltransferase involved in cell wall biosynthesis